MIYRNTTAIINLSNLVHNYNILKSLHKRDFFCPMVKANAYGHGDILIAQKLEENGCQYFGVVLVEEGIRLREAGIKNNILVFGTYTTESMTALLENNLSPVISDFGQLETLKKVSKNKKVKVHFKFNTGMNRLGFNETAAIKLSDEIKNNKNFILEGVCTHFLNSEDAEGQGFTEIQYNNFSNIKKAFLNQAQFFHCLNSASLLLRFHDKKDPHKNTNQFGARPGISLYGIKPRGTQTLQIDLKPVMQLKSYIAQLHEVKKNEVVSYGGTWKSENNSLIATVPIGYADGYFRSFSNKVHMLFRGKKVPVRGTVCMDYTMIDLTEFKNDKFIEVGEEVTVFGEQMGAQYHSFDVAKQIDLSPYEIITRISERVPRIYVG